VASQQRQLDLQVVRVNRTAETFLGLADPVLDGVLVHGQPFGGGLEAATFLPAQLRSTARWRGLSRLEASAGGLSRE
jgi:hypothetical protein